MIRAFVRDVFDRQRPARARRRRLAEDLGLGEIDPNSLVVSLARDRLGWILKDVNGHSIKLPEDQQPAVRRRRVPFGVEEVAFCLARSSRHQGMCLPGG